ncbi:LysR family transcriptional regulator [Tellurirhabdus rosea]|uniref:LysR family transcriptional regulator n=1 Tax=Tellurirhabdus rosea TaxID=2674997 RepID=UPI00225034B2|nr:LysR family transcriptional regulator [Tellurirhabdus rosea]
MLLRQLEYIVAVDNERSFTKAADNCCVTQPTLSQQIRVLEEHLRVEIFDRSRTPIEPTQRGRLIIEKARLVVSEARQLERFARELADCA